MRTLERLRWGAGRVGKSRAALLHLLVECDGELSRAEIAARLGRKPASLRAPLRWLCEAGLLERTRHGVYALPSEADFARRIEDARELGCEPEADRRQIARHARERDAFRGRHRHRHRDRPQTSETVSEVARPVARPDGFIGELERVPPESRQRDGRPEARDERRDEAERVQRLIAEGMSPAWARVEVLGGRAGL